MAIAASCCSWCVPFQPPMWAPITVSAQTRWDVPRARCGYTVRMRNLLAAILAGSLLPLLLLLLFFFVLFFAEIKLHPGASSSNDEHSNFIGGKRAIVVLSSAPSLHFLPLSCLQVSRRRHAMRPAGKGHGWCCPSCCSCCCWRRSAAQRDIQTEREPAIKKYIPTGVTQLPLSRPNPPSDVAAYAPAQVPPTPRPSSPHPLFSC